MLPGARWLAAGPDQVPSTASTLDLAWVRLMRAGQPAFDALEPGDLAIMPRSALEPRGGRGWRPRDADPVVPRRTDRRDRAGQRHDRDRGDQGPAAGARARRPHLAGGSRRPAGARRRGRPARWRSSGARSGSSSTIEPSSSARRRSSRRGWSRSPWAAGERRAGRRDRGVPRTPNRDRGPRRGDARGPRPAGRAVGGRGGGRLPPPSTLGCDPPRPPDPGRSGGQQWRPGAARRPSAERARAGRHGAHRGPGGA